MLFCCVETFFSKRKAFPRYSEKFNVSKKKNTPCLRVKPTSYILKQVKGRVPYRRYNAHEYYYEGNIFSLSEILKDDWRHKPFELDILPIQIIRYLKDLKPECLLLKNSPNDNDIINNSSYV